MYNYTTRRYFPPATAVCASFSCHLRTSLLSFKSCNDDDDDDDDQELPWAHPCPTKIQDAFPCHDDANRVLLHEPGSHTLASLRWTCPPTRLQ